MRARSKEWALVNGRVLRDEGFVDGLAVLVDGYINHFRFGDAHTFTLPQSFHFHDHTNRY